MTEFNADEIIDFLKFRFIHRSVEINKKANTLEGVEQSNYLHNSNKENLEELIEGVRKVERLATEIEKSGWNKQSCTYCKKLPFDEYGMRDNCKLSNECFPVKENKLKHFQWRVSIEDFK